VYTGRGTAIFSGPAGTILPSIVSPGQLILHDKLKSRANARTSLRKRPVWQNIHLYIQFTF
jgi:hypothetical protein